MDLLISVSFDDFDENVSNLLIVELLLWEDKLGIVFPALVVGSQGHRNHTLELVFEPGQLIWVVLDEEGQVGHLYISDFDELGDSHGWDVVVFVGEAHQMGNIWCCLFQHDAEPYLLEEVVLLLPPDGHPETLYFLVMGSHSIMALIDYIFSD